MSLKPSTVLACWLATWFVILQLVAPPGMMPSAGADGFEIIVCTPQGHQQVSREASGDQEPNEAQDSEFCVFSVAALKAPASASFDSFAIETAKPKHVFTLNKVGSYSISRRSHAPRAPPVFL